ncbi:MAG: hypothetical protein ACFFDF_19815 [Candidatus Odinarchaeota archaeon]
MSDIICPYCGKEKDPYDIMGDSDWDDQSGNWCKVECSCGKFYKVKQCDVEIIRHFIVEVE